MPIFRQLKPHDADHLAQIHAKVFETPWSAESFAVELAKPTTRAIASLGSEDEIVGFVLAQYTGDTAEILTIATTIHAQKQGVGAALVKELEMQLTARGISELLLDVADDNTAALALYEKTGFVRQNRRKAYYKRKNGPPVDAILMRRDWAGLP